jgi:formylglycine-generating enzyme required for sulfatase activity
MRFALLLLLTVPLIAQNAKTSATPAAPPAAAAKPGAASAKAATNAKIRKDPQDGLTYVWIPAGTFALGCPPDDPDCYSWEELPHAYSAKGFWIGQTEVTQAAYQAVTKVNPSAHRAPNLPVDQVTWYAARSFCAATGKRLPTENEWEYAARGLTNTPTYGPTAVVAWENSNSLGDTHPAGLKQPNKFGLYDMLGNVWEWTEDSYAKLPEFKMARGGAFLNPARDLRASNRLWLTPDTTHRDVGFRCVTDAE